MVFRRVSMEVEVVARLVSMVVGEILGVAWGSGTS